VAEPAATPNDEGFSRFYSTFENILSKLSAPLAFAGLPLISEEDPTSQTTDPSTSAGRKAKTQKERSGSEPELTKYISRAALRATAAGHSGNDSFYVVPPSGHTLSYAHILSFAEKEKRRLAASMHSEDPDLFADPNDEDDFFDAKETPAPISPTSSRRFAVGGRRLSGKEMENKVEELDLENKSLKEVVDKLSKRLHAFEMAAQNSSMALQESMRLMRPMSPGGGVVGTGSGGETLRKRVAELEQHVELGGKEIERLGRENEKLKSVVVRYRERWEKLKEGAKTRRGEGGKEGGGKEGQGKKDDPGAGRFVAG
jgi:hypothetical protein